MFEQSLVESSGRLRSKAGRWIGLTAAFNLAVLALLMVKPLLYPEALPPTVLSAMLTAPPPPPAAAPPRVAVTPKAVATRAVLDPFTAPTRVPRTVDTSHDDPPPSASVTGAVAMNSMGGGGLGPAGALGLDATPPPIPVTVKPPLKAALTRVSGGVIAGNKLAGSTPVYPPIAKAAHVSGAVVLHAVISKVGAIESLAVVSGPEMLRGSAVAAVQDWRYRPYLLNGEPTEVDTTITVNFSFGG